MAILNHHDLDELKNRNEEKVWHALEELLNTNPKLCRCRDCVLDAAALALNSLAPRYAVYSFHASGQEIEEPVEDVITAVAHAFEQVTKRPHHL